MAILVVVGLVGTGMLSANPKAGVSVTVSMKGAHSSPGGYGAKGGYPFDVGGTVDVDGAVLAKGGNEALKAIFNSCKDRKNSNAPVTAVEGDLKVADGKVTGNVKVTWNYQGNPLWCSGDIEGTITVSGGTATAISFEGKNVKAGGSWNWGGGAANLGGKGAFSVKSGN
ncbi:MAG: hypothetical protein A2Z34_07115 [Planctomycetes bacterium RBG_16_59_8]|nr:MAG: hypothetical protein A2Z34_07115 [Planctomycetes bacterium RBG_16_59_8]